MVQAIIEGRKTCTRRLNKKVPQGTYRIDYIEDGSFDFVYGFSDGEVFADSYKNIKPQYQVNDILYVRETWQLDPKGFEETPPEYWWSYKASSELPKECTKWRPSIHMPKEAARIFLKITNVRVERLQDMEHDAPLKEGINCFTKDGTVFKYSTSEDWIDWKHMPKNPTTAFQLLWDSTVDKKDLDKYGWNANPWVWVYELERCEKPQEQLQN